MSDIKTMCSQIQSEAIATGFTFMLLRVELTSPCKLAASSNLNHSESNYFNRQSFSSPILCADDELKLSNLEINV